MNRQSSHNPARAPRLSRRRFLKGALAFGAGLAGLRFAPVRMVDLPVAQAASPDLVWGPYLQSSTPDSMIVTWATRVNDASEVRYSVGGGAENVVAATAQRITKSGA